MIRMILLATSDHKGRAGTPIALAHESAHKSLNEYFTASLDICQTGVLGLFPCSFEVNDFDAFRSCVPCDRVPSWPMPRKNGFPRNVFWFFSHGFWNHFVLKQTNDQRYRINVSRIHINRQYSPVLIIELPFRLKNVIVFKKNLKFKKLVFFINEFSALYKIITRKTFSLRLLWLSFKLINTPNRVHPCLTVSNKICTE